MPTFSYVDKNGKSRTIDAISPQEAMSKAPEIDPHSGVQLVPSAVNTSGTGVPEKAAGDISGGLSGGANTAPAGASAVGDLGNLRMALRSALNEAAGKRVESNFRAVAPEGIATPGTVGSVVDLIRSGIKTSTEQTFNDITTSYKDATDLKRKELDRINELRAEYGSAVPSSVTDLKTALDLISPLVDQKKKLELQKLQKDQQSDEDVESAADFVAKGGSLAQVGGSSEYKARVRIRANELMTQLEATAKEEYKNRIAFRLEKKTSDFNTERALTLQDDNLSVAEQRDVIDYIDGLEQAQKGSKKSGGGFFSFLNPTPDATPSAGAGAANVYGNGNFATVTIDNRLNQLKEMFGSNATVPYLEKQLLQDGYNPDEIKKRTRTNFVDKLFQ